MASAFRSTVNRPAGANPPPIRYARVKTTSWPVPRPRTTPLPPRTEQACCRWVLLGVCIGVALTMSCQLSTTSRQTTREPVPVEHIRAPVVNDTERALRVARILAQLPHLNLSNVRREYSTQATTVAATPPPTVEQAAGKQRGEYDESSNEAARRDLISKIVAIPIMPTLAENQTMVMVNRMRHVLAELAFLGMPAEFIKGTTWDDGSFNHMNLMKENLFMALRRCMNTSTTFEYCFIFQDDAKFHNDFWRLAARLLNALPAKLVLVHLCPGPLSPTLPDLVTRKHQNLVYTGPPIRGRDPRLFDTEHMLKNVANPEGGAYFPTWPRLDTPEKLRVIAGQPVSFIIRRSQAVRLYKRLRSSIVWRRGGGDDVRLTRKFTIVDEDGTEDCFVARQPLLCYHLMGNSTRTGSAQTVPFPYHD